MLQTGGRIRRGYAGHAATASLLAYLLVIATVLAACGGSSGPKTASGDTSTGSVSAGRTGGTIVWARNAEPPELDPPISPDVGSLQLLYRVYEGLVAIGDDLKPAPRLATSWEQKSSTSWIFNIRDGVKFSNGREMTLDDVVGSLRRLVDPKTASYWAPQIGKVEHIVAKGNSQVEIVLAEPNAYFLPALANVAASILPMKELKARTFDPHKDTLGTGPFRVTAHRQGESWTLVRNQHYWNPSQPKVDQLTIRVMTDDTARVAALRDGSVDVVTFDTPDAVKLLAGQANVKTIQVPTTDYYRIDVNAKSSVFADSRLREALSLAIDRNELNQVALGGTGKPTAAAPLAFDVCDPAAVPYSRPDPERAAMLVKEAGAKGKTVSIAIVTADSPFGRIAQVLQQRLEKTGLNVKLEQVEIGQLVKRVWSGKAKFDLTDGYLAGFSDPAMVLTWWGPGVSWNKAWMRTDDKQLQTSIVQSRTETDENARKDAIRVACERIAANANLIPLVTKPNFVAYRSDKINLPIPKVDVFADPLYRAADISLKRG